MKVVISGYEVEIKARRLCADRNTKKDTMEILNLISLYMSEASYQWKAEGADALAEMARDDAAAVYKVLDANGLYK